MPRDAHEEHRQITAAYNRALDLFTVDHGAHNALSTNPAHAIAWHQAQANFHEASADYHRALAHWHIEHQLEQLAPGEVEAGEAQPDEAQPEAQPDEAQPDEGQPDATDTSDAPA